MEQKKYSGSPLWYVIGGVAIGAVLGVFFAPKKGSELRSDIGEWARMNRETSKTLMTRLSSMIPFRVKAAATLGAIKAGGAEAIQVAKEDLHLDGANK